MNIPNIISDHIKRYSKRLNAYPKLKKMYSECYLSTLKTAVIPCKDNTYFIITGDIPAMWLRDSSAQIEHYIPLSHDSEISSIIEGVIRRQFMYIKTDPYANAFNRVPDSSGHTEDLPAAGPYVFERKYETDSLCYPIRLLYMYWKHSGNTHLIKQYLEDIVKIILKVWETEQYHSDRSNYEFFRPGSCEQDTLPLNKPVYTGMTWTGFRPSDDRCSLGYLTASNMFAAVVLGYMAEMLNEVCNNRSLADQCIRLQTEIGSGINKYAVFCHKKYGKVFACETDGSGNYSFFDDANIPSLLSAPFIGYLKSDDIVYQNTRRLILSNDNPYYYKGSFAQGIGSPHTPPGYIWHLSLIMQALTSRDRNEILSLVEILSSTDDNTYHMHEGFCADDPSIYTRPWFTWPDSLFAALIEKCVDEEIL